MRDRGVIGVVVASGLLAGAGVADEVAGGPGADAPYVSGEVVIAFAAAPDEAALEAVSEGRPIASWREIAHAPHPKGDPDGVHPLALVRVATLAPGADAAAVAAQLAGVPGVRYAEPNFLTQVDFDTNDPLFGSQYGPQIVDAPGAWDLTLGDASVVMAVADTGINYGHEDFQEGAIWVNPGEVPGNGIDDDGNGYVDDVTGWDTINDDASNTDQGGHGSHVAGTMAARLNNGVGMAGMANVTIMPIQVFSAGGGGTYESITEAVYYAVDNGAGGINYSGGGNGGSQMLLEAAEYAWDHGVSFIAAAGNNNSAAPHYPAYYPTVLAISGTDSNDERYTGSNYGAWIDVAAPGVNVFSCWWNGPTAYNTITGTSMSTPHVSGLVALMLSQNPFLTPQEVRDLLREHAVDLGDEGFDIFFGYGRIDAAATLAAVPNATLAIGFPEGLPEVVGPGEEASFLVQIDELNETIVPGTEALYVRDAGEDAYAPVALSDLGGGLYEAVLPAKPCGPATQYYVAASTNEGSVVTSPAGAPEAFYGASVGVLEEVVLDTFEDDLGWEAEVLGASSGHWQRGVPVNDPLWDFDPESDSDGSGSAFLTQNEMGNTDVDGGAVRLTSAPIDMAGGDVVISYDYYLNLQDNDDAADRLVVEIAPDGGAWVEIASHGASGGLDWQSHAIGQADLDAAGVAPTGSMRVRFTANDAGTPSIVEAGVDHFAVSVVSCGGACEADFNGDGELSILDFVAFQQAFVAGGEDADFNGDGELSILDFVAFQQAFVAGC